MAKDKRKNRPAGTSAKKTAGTAPRKPARSRKKKMPVGKIVLLSLLSVLILVSLIFIVVLAKYLWDTLKPSAGKPDVSVTSHDTTPESDRDKVAYYVLGLLGAEEGDATEMLSLVCHDKQKNTVQILQLPQDTYLDAPDHWAVNKVGEVWSNPKPLTFCEAGSCGCRVFEPEIKDGKHTVCGTPLTEKAGSATGNVVDIFDSLLSMPVDGYFLLQQGSFVQLVDAVDGVDVQLVEKLKVDDVEYAAGVQTLDGKAALQYINTRKSGVEGDVERLVRQRGVFVSLFQRLFAASDEALTDDIIGPVMYEKYPIRVPSQYRTATIVPLLRELSKVPFANMTAYILPGGVAKSDGVSYYAPLRAQTIELLNRAFNPYGEPITEGSVLIVELNGTKEGELYEQTLSDLVVEQSGAAAPDESSAAAE